MTREGAISLLKGISRTMIPSDDDNPVIEALGMAVKALEQEPTDDATLKDIFCMGCEYKEQEPKTGHWIYKQYGSYPECEVQKDVGIACIHYEEYVTESEVSNADSN